MHGTEKALIILPSNPKNIKRKTQISESETFDIYKAILHDTSDYYIYQKNARVCVYFPDYETYDMLVQVFPLRVKIFLSDSNHLSFSELVRECFSSDVKFIVLFNMADIFYPVTYIDSAFGVLTHRFDVIVSSFYEGNPNWILGMKRLHDKILTVFQSEPDEMKLLKAISELDVLYVPLREIETIQTLDDLRNLHTKFSGISDPFKFKRSRILISQILKKHKVNFVEG